VSGVDSVSIDQAKEVLRIEAEGVMSLVDRVGQSFAQAVEMIFAAKGRLIVTGIGKSGIVGRKIVATLNSTGTPALFLHPVEGMHGDLGMVIGQDVVLALSNSGETDELNAIIPALKRLGAKVIAFTGGLTPTLAELSDVVIDVSVAREACPLGLAPTASTTAATAMGDALAVCLLSKRGFKETDFAARHPGGRLGQRLAIKVGEVMSTGAKMPLVGLQTPMDQVIAEMDVKDLGTALVVDEEGRLLGILTDGDLRRGLRNGREIGQLLAGEMMIAQPKTVSANAQALDALEIMEKYEITALPIVEADGRVSGLVHLHDLLGRGRFSFRPHLEEEEV